MLTSGAQKYDSGITYEQRSLFGKLHKRFDILRYTATNLKYAGAA